MPSSTLSRRPSGSYLVAILAIVLATGSASYAAGLARGSVGTAQLRTGAVTTPKIAGGAVTGSKVRDSSIGRRDLADGVLPPRSTSVRRALAIAPGLLEVRLATVEGIAYVARCNDTPVGNGAVGVLVLRTATSGSPANPLRVSVVSTRRNGTDPASVVTISGAAEPVTDFTLATITDSGDRGDATASGVVQHAGQMPARVDLAVSAVATSPEGRGCRFHLVITPTG